MTKAGDSEWMERAIEIALASEEEGNLPVGCVITLGGEAIAEGNSAVLEPEYDPGRHAEIEAVRRVETALWPRAAEMTCYTTLEPCVMCAGTLLLHGVGRVVFGARDVLGGAGPVLEHLPPYYDEGGVFDWEGPLMPDVCDPLYERADTIFSDLPVGRNQWSERRREPTDEERLEKLETWAGQDDRSSGIREIRKVIRAVSIEADHELLEQLLPYAQAVFRETGYRKDYRALKRYARRAGKFDAIEEVGMAVRRHLPDIWIERALDRGDVDAAIECWFEHEEHRRIRHCADALVEACDAAHVDVVISCRLSVVEYLIGRRKRKHYRKACAVLRKLRDELERAGEADYWPVILEDIRRRYSGRPALIDELRRARFIS